MSSVLEIRGSTPEAQRELACLSCIEAGEFVV